MKFTALFWKFENTTNGLMLMPTENVILLENSSLHAVLAVAYDDDAYALLFSTAGEAALIWKDISSCIMTIS